MHCSDSRHVQHLCITTLAEPMRVGGTHIVAPLTALVGIRIHTFEVASDVEITPEVREWIDTDVRSRVLVGEGGCCHSAS